MTPACADHRRLVLLGFSGLLISALLLWNRFPHYFYAGLDGNLFEFTIQTYLNHTRPFSINAVNIFQGLGSPLIQMNVWMNPGYLVFALFDPEVARVISAGIFLGVYCFSTYFLARTLGLPVLPAIIAGQLAILVFPPFQYSTGFNWQFVLNPGVTYHIALLTLMLCLILKLSSCRFSSILANALAIAAIYAYSIYCDPLWTVVISVAFVIPFAVCLFADGTSQAFWARVFSLCIAALILYFLGIIEYVYSLASSTARVFFQPEVVGETQTPGFVSILFQTQKAGLTYWLLFVGWIFGLVFTSGKRRLFALLCLIYMVFIFVLGGAYLFLDINWNYPIPMYYEQSVYHLYILGAVCGWTGLLVYYKELILRLYIRFIKPAISSIIRRADFVVVLNQLNPALRLIGKNSNIASKINVAGILVVPLIVICYFIDPPSGWAFIYKEKPPRDIGLVQRLQHEIGALDDQPFRGSVAFPSAPTSMPKKNNALSYYEKTRILHSFWTNGIPTLEIYGQMVPPSYFYFVSRLLNSEAEPIGRNGIGVTVLNTSALQVLGIKFVINEGAISSASPDLVEKSVGNEDVHLYELKKPNVGNYAPTRMHVSTDAGSSIEIMRSRNFNFENDVVITKKIEFPLYPAKNSGFYFKNGDIRVWGESDGHSLIVLPVQFSRCLQIPDQSAAEIRRANLTLAGILFHKKIDTTIRSRLGFFSPECRIEDLRELKLLKFLPEDTRRKEKKNPYLLLRLNDLKRQAAEVLGELLP